jgi:hypothetical protein
LFRASQLLAVPVVSSAAMAEHDVFIDVCLDTFESSNLSGRKAIESHGNERFATQIS